MHPLDAALTLTPTHDHHYRAHTSAAYQNMVGPYGGITAATLLQGVLQHPQCLGEPVALTVNFAAAVQPGAFTVQATPVRTNRSTQHWTLALWQDDAQGTPQLTTSATAVTALRRETWSASDQPMPQTLAPQAYPCSEVASFTPEWLQRYEVRPIVGALPMRWDGGDYGSCTQLWMRDAPTRVLDFPALAALADIFIPRVWLRRAHLVPAGTVSLTVYFHASAALLQATGTGYLLGQARAQEFRHGFFDHSAQLWNEAGQVLATSHQIVYYKE